MPKAHSVQNISIFIWFVKTSTEKMLFCKGLVGIENRNIRTILLVSELD